MSKVSIRFFNDREVRAIWDDEKSKWWFSVLDIVGVLNDQDDYEKNRNYWKYLKAKLKKEGNQLGSVTTQFIPFFLQLGFQVFPVVAGFDVVVLVSKYGNYIQHAKPPFGVLLVPNSPHFPVVKETYGYFCVTHNYNVSYVLIDLS